jgi:zinc-ribbon domain
MYCPECGVANGDNANFCSKCGHPLQSLPATAPLNLDSGHFPVKAKDSGFVLVIKPWTPIASLEQARMLTKTGVVTLGIIAVLALLGTIQTQIGIWGLIGAAIYAGCAVGTARNSRAAAYIGFGLTVIILLASFAILPAVIITIPLTLGALAGVRGVLNDGGTKTMSGLTHR